MLLGREVYVNRIGWVSAALLVTLGATHQAIGPGASPEAKQQAQQGTGSHPAQSETIDLCAALRASFSLPPQEPNQSGACLPGEHNIRTRPSVGSPIERKCPLFVPPRGVMAP